MVNASSEVMNVQSRPSFCVEDSEIGDIATSTHSGAAAGAVAEGLVNRLKK